MLETNNDCILSIRNIIANEIESYAKEMNLSVREAIREISTNTGLGVRTLERYAKSEVASDPYVKTVILFYSHIYKTKSLSELLLKVPEQVATYINKEEPGIIIKSLGVDTSIDPQEDAAFTSDSMVNQIYLHASREFPKSLDYFQHQFGVNGLKKIDTMIDKGYLKINNAGEILRDKKLLWSRKTISNFSKTLIADIFNDTEFDLFPENYEAFGSFDTTLEDAQEIKNTLKAAFRSSFKIASESSPTRENRVNIAFSSIMTRVGEFEGELQ